MSLSSGERVTVTGMPYGGREGVTQRLSTVTMTWEVLLDGEDRPIPIKASRLTAIPKAVPAQMELAV